MSEVIEGQEPINPEAGEPKPQPEVVPKSEADKLYARMKQAEENEKKLKEELEKAKPQQDFDNLMEEKIDLRLEGYTSEEIKFIQKNSEGKSLKEATKDPWIKAAIEGRRAEASADKATPTPSSRTLTVGDKTFKDMTPQERSENFSGEAWRRRKQARG